MLWVKLFFLLTFVSLLCAEEQNEETTPENEREMRQFNQEGWHAVQNFHPGNSDWVPKEPQSTDQQQVQKPLKRRRLRKRKRRPPVSEENPEGEERPLRRRVRPQRLEQMEENLDEMNAEGGHRPHNRRRVQPVYQEPAGERPLSASIQISDEAVTESSEENLTFNRKEEIISKPDLKTLLKQNGNTLSLSEILQQKNLSLSELLMGNEKAISALTEPSTTTEETVVQYKRVPPSIGLRKTINRNFEQTEDSTEMLSTKEAVEAQRKRLALLNSYKENKLFKFEVVTEPTTEKRIFVPSHPKYYTSMNYKPDFEQIVTSPATEFLTEETTTSTSTTTTTPIPTTTEGEIKSYTNRMNLKPKLKTNLPMTNAKLNKMVNNNFNTKQEIQKQEEIKPIKIDVNEIFGFTEAPTKPTTKSPVADEPFRMQIEIEEPKTTSQPQTTTQPANVPVEKMKYTEAKEEIMEILRDPIGRAKLARILEIRNMTIEQLVEQRERGSSQLHLADIFHNKTREPDPKDEPLVVGHISSEYFSSFPIFGRKQKSRVFRDETTTGQTPQKPEDETKPMETLSVTNFPTYKIELEKSLKETQPFLWKELYPDFLATIYENNKKKLQPIEKITTEIYHENEIQHLDETESKFSELRNQELNANLDRNIFESKNYDEVLIQLPTGVKSAILASLGIVSLSLIVFVTILMMFKWSQKKKTRLNYCSSFSSRIKAPMLVQDTGKNIKTFMTETLGRKKSYYKQNLPENIWENERKSSF